MIEPHIPVLLSEVLENIGVIEGNSFLDLTFGEGGHSHALLRNGASRVVGVDRDQEAIQSYQHAGEFRLDQRLKLIHTSFSKVSEYLTSTQFDGMLLDLGVSTRQLLEPDRGFSFRGDQFLDMRMDRSSGIPAATAAIRNASLRELSESLDIAGVKKAPKVAAALKELAASREQLKPSDLASLGNSRDSKRHPATQLYLGIRLLVNREFEEISQGIPQLLKLLKPGGRLLIITFHSAEDRLVKRLLATLAGKCICEGPICQCSKIRNVAPIFPKPIQAQRLETRVNPRSRSAKLRGVFRIVENGSPQH